MWRLGLIAYQNICLDIGKDKPGAVQERLLLAVNQSSSPMSSSPPGSQCLLLFGKLGSSTREVGQNEDGDHSNGDDDSALDDEQPMPGHQLKGALK